MKRVFVVSPLRGTDAQRAPLLVAGRVPFESQAALYAANESRAEERCREVALAGHAPLAPHLFFTRFLDDHVPAEREAGINAGLAWLSAADEVWVDGADGISTGMAAEIEAAKRRGIPIYYPPRWNREP